MNKTELMRSIIKIDNQLEENKRLIDLTAGADRETLGAERFDRMLKLADLSVDLMVARRKLQNELHELYGITIISGMGI